MKKNAQLLALLMCPIETSQELYMTTAGAKNLLPTTTDGGVRSLLHHLSKIGILSQERLEGDVRYYLTEDGVDQLNALFPALNPDWDDYTGQWDCIVFMQAPVGDPQFRYLRTQLVAEKALQLSRGVYCIPGKISDSLSVMCKKLYRDSVAIFSIDSWKQGFERSTVTHSLSLGDLATAYSSIGKEADQLLAFFETRGGLTEQQKSTFLSVCDRFRDILNDDVGILKFYYPNARTARDVLVKIQRVFMKQTRRA